MFKTAKMKKKIADESQPSTSACSLSLSDYSLECDNAVGMTDPFDFDEEDEEEYDDEEDEEEEEEDDENEEEEEEVKEEYEEQDDEDEDEYDEQEEEEEEVEEDDDEISDEDIRFGKLQGTLVGLQFYDGKVNIGDRVKFERNPQNTFDTNAIQVKNASSELLGYIERKMAKPLANIVDNGLARLTGHVSLGYTGRNSVPVTMTLWGKPYDKKNVVDTLNRHGCYMKHQCFTGSVVYSSTDVGMSHGKYRKIQHELDRVMEASEDVDKTSQTEPSETIITPLYQHQKQALSWMIRRENNTDLPPFWEKRDRKFYNVLLQSETDERPESIKGGILADDMGLGKTLTMIALILTNFVDNRPLATRAPAIVSSTTMRTNSSKKVWENTQQQRIAKKKAYCDFKDHERSIIQPDLTESCSEESNFLSTISNTIDIEDDDDVIMLPETSHEEEVITISDSSDESDIDALNVTSKDDRTVWKEDGRDDVASYKSTADATVMHTGEIKRKFKMRIRLKRKSSDDPEFSDEEDDLAKRKTFKKKKKTQKIDSETFNENNQKTKTDIVKQETTTTKTRETTEVEKYTGGMSIGHIKEMPVFTDDCSTIIVDLTKDTTDEEKPNCVDINTTDASSNRPSLTDINLEEIFNDIYKLDENICQPATPERRCTLIVCPKSVLSNWQDQLEVHLHKDVELKVYMYYGKQKNVDSNFLGKQDIVITTYTTISWDVKNKRRPLQDVKWLRIVLDECAIRNPYTQQTQAILCLNTERKWVLTGTPIQNSMQDLWSIVNFLGVSPWTDIRLWKVAIEGPLNTGDVTAVKIVQHLIDQVALRRTKTQKVDGKPLIQLTERNVFIEHVTLSQEERIVYDALENEGSLVVSKFFQDGKLQTKYTDILTILIRLRQLCCHPTIVIKAVEKMAKDEKTHNKVTLEGIQEELKRIDKMLMLLHSEKDEDCSICLNSLQTPVITHCAHAFCRSCILDVIKNEKPFPKCPLCRGDIQADQLVYVPLDEIRDKGQDKNTPSLTGDWASSAKVDALFTALLKLRSENGDVKSLVVSQFTKFLDLLETPLRNNHFQFVRLDGKMSANARKWVMRKFSNKGPDSPTIMLLSLRAGGVGINLTAATRVFLMDPAWTPAAEEQCFDRCHRLGQTKDVVITKFIVENSVEERILKIQEKKRQLMEGAFGKKQTKEERRREVLENV